MRKLCGEERAYLGRPRASGPLCGAPCFARSHGVVPESWRELILGPMDGVCGTDAQARKRKAVRRR